MGEGFALVGIKACGCATRAMVDDDETTPKARAEFYRGCGKDRMLIERWPVERVRTDLRRCRCAGSGIANKG